LQFTAVGFQIREDRYADPFESAFLAEDIEENCSRWARFVIPEKIDDIIEVAGTCALGQRPYLLPEQFLVGISEDADPFRRSIAIGMEYAGALGYEHNAFVRGKVELEAREVVGR
jgi:hypothetical protein